MVVLDGVGAAPASAATLSMAFMVSTGTDFLNCFATKVGEKPIASVTVGILGFDNGVIGDNTCTDVAPSAGCSAASSTGVQGHCRVTSKGAKKNLRAAMYVIDSGSNIRATLPAE